MEREPNTQYVLSYSYGKDSGACIHVIRDILGWPLDRIVTADVWATKDIPAVLPEMWEWQQKADEIILQRYGIPVEHFCATKKAIPLNVGGYKYTFEDHFYERMQRGGYAGNFYGFPKTSHGWCKKLKLDWLPNWQRETDLRGYLLSRDVSEEQDLSEICRGGVLQRQGNSNVQRISDAEGELVQLRTQDSCVTVFRGQDADGVQGNSRRYGFPHTLGGWCHRFKEEYYKQELKRSFLPRPLDRGRLQILSSTSGLRQMSRSA